MWYRKAVFDDNKKSQMSRKQLASPQSIKKVTNRMQITIENISNKHYEQIVADCSEEEKQSGKDHAPTIYFA